MQDRGGVLAAGEARQFTGGFDAADPAGHWCDGAAGPHAWGTDLISERATRIELALSAWEAEVLPLNYARVVRRPLYLGSVDRPCTS